MTVTITLSITAIIKLGMRLLVVTARTFARCLRIDLDEFSMFALPLLDDVFVNLDGFLLDS